MKHVKLQKKKNFSTFVRKRDEDECLEGVKEAKCCQIESPDIWCHEYYIPSAETDPGTTPHIIRHFSRNDHWESQWSRGGNLCSEKKTGEFFKKFWSTYDAPGSTFMGTFSGKTMEKTRKKRTKTLKTIETME